ncbi:hypothetical protein LTR86_005516 [Recurvomyces mirabilis]|nr:hypothetical protein LTR86_005516 [Recurvomyces mirabilis]
MSPFLTHLRSQKSLASANVDPAAPPQRSDSTTTIRKAESTPTKSEGAPAPSTQVTRSTWMPRWSPKSQAQTPETSPPIQTQLDEEPVRTRSESTDTIRTERPKSHQIPGPPRVDPLTSPLTRHFEGREMLGALRAMGSPGFRQLTDDQIAAIQATFSVPSAEELAIRAAQEIDWSLTPYMRWRRYGDIALHRPRNLDMSTSDQPRQRTSQETVMTDQAGRELVRRTGLPSRYRNGGQRNRVSPRLGSEAGFDPMPRSSCSISSRSSQETFHGEPRSSNSSYEAIPRYQLYDAPMDEQGTEPSNPALDHSAPCAESQAAMQTLYDQLDAMISQNADAAASPRMNLSEAMPGADVLPGRSRPAGQGPVPPDIAATDEVACQERRDTAFEVPSAATTSPTLTPKKATQAPSIRQIAHHLRDSTPTPHTRKTPLPKPTPTRDLSLHTKINTLNSIKTSLLATKQNSTTPPSEQTLLSEITWLRADIRHLSHHRPSEARKKVLADFKLEEKKVELGLNRAWQAEGGAKAAQIETGGQKPRPRGDVQWPPPNASVYGRRHDLTPKPSPAPSSPRTRQHSCCPWRIELYKTLPRWKSIFGPAKSVEVRWPPSSSNSVYGRRRGLSALVPPPLTREASYSGPASPVEETEESGGCRRGNLISGMEHLGRMGVM